MIKIFYADAAASATAASTLPQQQQQFVMLTEEDCLELGFDPSNLSCDTCDILHSLDEESNFITDKEKFQSECKSCCKDWIRYHHLTNSGHVDEERDNIMSSLSSQFFFKYEAAIFIHATKDVEDDTNNNRNNRDPFAMMMYQHNINEEVNEFVEKHLETLTKSKGENRLQYKKVPISETSKIQFFRNAREVDDMQTSEADEEVNLKNWKKEDILQMLETLIVSS